MDERKLYEKALVLKTYQSSGWIFLMAKASKYDNRMKMDEVRNEIANGHPRVSALLAGAVLDEVLSVTIEAALVALSKKEKEAIFEGNGPLATFSARIKIAYAMGLINKEIRRDLDTIRGIRNDFAHELRGVDLDHEEYKNKIRQMHSTADTSSSHTVSSLLSYVVSLLAESMISKASGSSFWASRELTRQLENLKFSDEPVRKLRDGDRVSDSREKLASPTLPQKPVA